MRRLFVVCALALAAGSAHAQTKKAPRPAPARKSPAKPPEPPPLTRVPATCVCPAELGDGVASKRRFCDVLIGRDPKEGITVLVPLHQGTVTLSLELHNRHTYSAELVKKRMAYRHYTATVGVLLMDGTLVDRGVVDSEFRTEADLYDRIGGGAGPGGVKAVAPTGTEFLQFTLPEGVTEVSILGERLTVVGPEGTDQFTTLGRPIASISNVMLEYRPQPPPRPATKKRG